MILLIAAIVIIGFIIYQYAHAKHDNKEVVICNTGTIGSGKTYRATHKLLFDYKLCNLIYKLKGKKKGSKPIIYSNIPLYIDKKTDVRVLKREHLLLKEKFEEGCTPLVVLDEISMIATCYNWNDKNIVSDNINDNMNTLETFIRLFRHFYGGNNHDRCRLYITDQATGGINIQMRRRIGFVNYLYNFHRCGLILPFYKVNVKQMVIQEDTVNENNVDLTEKEQQYYFGHLPYKWLHKKKKPLYDSHCFEQALKDGKFVSKLDYDIWPKYTLKTNYCPDIRMTEEEKNEYKTRIKYMNKMSDIKVEQLIAGL